MGKEYIVFDSYNGRIKADQAAINTLTTNCGAYGMREGVKVVEYEIKTGCTDGRLRKRGQHIFARRLMPNDKYDGGGTYSLKLWN